MKQIQIALVDDHSLVCQGFSKLLASNPPLNVCITARSGPELLQKMTRQKVDVVLTDVSMPVMSGVELTKIICRDYKWTKVIGLSMHIEHWYIREMLMAGAKGYVGKSAEPEDIIAAVMQVAGGGVYFCQESSRSLAGKYLEMGEGRMPPNLTPREITVLDMLFNEKSDAEIARLLNVSVKTVGNVKRTLMEKTGVKSVVGLARWVIDHCLN